MNAIPSGVEASLLDAGFTSTEVLIIRRLLEYDALTLRGLASVTGKSTGVLDATAKKLSQKGIIRRETINGAAKFTLTSLDAVLQWMETDTRRKNELMTRRQQTFESFLRSFEHTKHRPAIEYFEGLEGIAGAYRKLLESGKEIIGYVPVFCSIEDHPLRDFLVEWFRKRLKQKIFSRIITHNTPLGRRYQSRDIFEYRKTLLIEDSQLPFTYEKLICGNTVACFNYTEKRACMLHFPELASMEKTFFESVWRQLANKDEPLLTSSPAPTATPPAPAIQPVTLSVRAMSALRDFFLSKKSIAAFAGITVLSAAITFGLYAYTRKLQFERMQETVKSIAATGAFQFDAKDLDALQVEKDWKKPEWGRVVKQLQQIRKSNDDVVFAYIFRKNKNDPSKMDFVSDSHSLNPYANTDTDTTNNVDADQDGIIDPEGHDKLQWPGQPYPEPVIEIYEAYNGQTVTSAMVSDSFGNVLTGFAPIKDANGRVAGIIGVDMKATLLTDRTTEVFQPTLFFIGFFLMFVLVRLAAFNRSLFLELWKGLQMRKMLVAIIWIKKIF